MAGRIREEDIAAIRERVSIDDVVREYVTLKSAGSGAFKGLCPFHDERSPSFHVTPARGGWYCFGCSEGGDVFTFIQRMEHIGFVEAVERLADRAGVELRYTSGVAPTPEERGQRTRLLAAHKDAEAFYRANLGTEESAAGIAFLRDRGFDKDAADRFGVGYAPKGWDNLTRHLLARGHTADDLVAGGLATRTERGVFDKFRGRLIWPIRSVAGETIGFGARKLYDDDDGPKYLNTSETPLYKKSQVLYGLDLARKDIARSKSAIVVEGYTDVMACHLAGFTTAVAACGTAFGGDHVAVMRRFLMDDDAITGEVTFTFDGDAAGQKAALRAFSEDQRFTARTFVAIAPQNMDPCELRMAQGDAGIRSLIDSRVPLFEFAIKSTLSGTDLDTANGRIQALELAAPIVARIKDPVLRPEYARLLAGWVGVDVNLAQKAVSRAGSGTISSPASLAQQERTVIADAEYRPEWAFEREALKCMLQRPDLVGDWMMSVEATAFTRDAHRAVHATLADMGEDVPSPAAERIDRVCQALGDDQAAVQVVRELSVEPLAVETEEYATATMARLMELDASRRIKDLKSRAQRATDPTERQTLLTDLIAVETYRRELLEACQA